MTEPRLPWNPTPPTEETYVAVNEAVLRAIRALDWMKEYNPASLHAVRLVLRVARLDEISGQMVIGIRFVHDLEPPEPPADSGHFGT